MDIPNLRVHASVIALAATQSKLLALVYDSLACVRKLSESGARSVTPSLVLRCGTLPVLIIWCCRLKILQTTTGTEDSAGCAEIHVYD